MVVNPCLYLLTYIYKKKYTHTHSEVSELLIKSTEVVFKALEFPYCAKAIKNSQEMF